MGKTETIGIIFITLVLFVWMFFNTPKQPPHPKQQTGTEQAVGTGNHENNASAEATKPPTQTSPVPMEKALSAAASDTTQLRLYGKTFNKFTHGTPKTITIETGLYKAVLTSEGGMIDDWTLTKYKTWNGAPVELVNYKSNRDYSLVFQTMDGKLIDTRGLYFDASYRNGEVVQLTKNQIFKVKYTLNVNDSTQIVRAYTFKGGVYNFGSQITFKNMAPYIANYQYQVTWEHGLNYTEENSVDESSFSTAYADNGGELVSLEASKLNHPVKQILSGNTSWISQTTKYFTVAIVSKGKPADGAYLHGDEHSLPNNGLKRQYFTALDMRYQAQPVQTDSFMVYVGPLDYNILKSYNVGLEGTVGLGWHWVIRPIAEYVMLPAFEFLHSFIPNYGIVIIIFAIALKIILNPLTVSSMKSMRKMQALQPLMEEIKAKYKEEPQKMNQAVMNLYKEYKVNPMGGCLPMVLQLPILYALWAIFRSNIVLRQSDFIWWIKDLSIPDTVLRLPFTLPFVGMNQISGLAVLMAVTQFFQMKMTTKDPRQQFMIYGMPIFMWLIFNNLPSGLNLYYFVFSALSIGQQYFLNKKPMEEVLVKPAAQKKKGRPTRPPMGNRAMRRM